MTTKTTKDKPKEVDYNKRANIVLGVGVGVVVLFPLLFTQLPSIMDFTETGQIGDTIGGITAPFVGLVGAILVYYSFKQQMIANQIQVDSIKDIKKENLDNHLINLINDLSNKCVNEIKDFELNYSDEYGNNYIRKEAVAFEDFYKVIHKEFLNLNTDRLGGVYSNKFKALNDYVFLILTTIKKLSSNDLQAIYLRVYQTQIHNIIYKGIRDFDGEIDVKHKYIYLYNIAKRNDEIYRTFGAWKAFSD